VKRGNLYAEQGRVEPEFGLVPVQRFRINRNLSGWVDRLNYAE